MSGGQAPPGSSWRNHPPREPPGPAAGGSAGRGPWRSSALRRQQAKLLETEKSPSVLSFHWKEEHLLRRQLGLLDAMKKRQARVWVSEQKAFYRRCHLQLRRVELAHARLQGNRDLVQQLSCPSRWTYSSRPSEESAAAVRAILQGRLGSKDAGTRRCSRGVLLSLTPEEWVPAASRGAVEAEEPWWASVGEAPRCPKPRAPRSELPTPEAGPQPWGELLLYLTLGEPDEEQEQPRD